MASPDEPLVISPETIRQVTAIGVYDNHQVTTRPTAGRFEARCSCGWTSDDAYGQEYRASQAGDAHQADELEQALSRVGLG